ncbi:unnamed protein product [Miscanthus lutarioriparius]|uniref:Uncharacterized protein n=1 Tax=Miscanthus lutarioriparius TaxID=422564 RepID=A0A811NR56_9POAL|nr:unnamed protein product [Miscanthus lutarioriparius]
MQGGRSASAVEAAKEAAANVGTSAWAGKEKTKAVVQEKVAKARAHDPAEKAAADARMQERVREVRPRHPTPLGDDGTRCWCWCAGCYDRDGRSSEAARRRRRPT